MANNKTYYVKCIKDVTTKDIDSDNPKKTPISYKEGEVYEVSDRTWNWLLGCKQLNFENADGARAKTAKGKFKADDPTTPDVNEAYKGGKKPKKSKPKAKPKAKKKSKAKA